LHIRTLEANLLYPRVADPSSYFIFTFTVVESGKPADASVIFFEDCIIEYYENGAPEPTKVKEIKVIE